MRRRTHLPLLIWLLPLALACTTSTQVVSSGPPAATKLSDLDTAQRLTLCTSTEAALLASGEQRVTHAQCLAAAGLGPTSGPSDPVLPADMADSQFIGAPLPPSCERRYDDCMVHSSAASDLDAGVPSPCSVSAFEGCDATVAEFRQCYEASAKALVDALSKKSCADVNDADGGVAWGESSRVPAACASLYARCPDVILTQPWRPACSAELKATGAITADVQWPTEQCQPLPTQNPFWGGFILAVGAPAGAPFDSARFAVMDQPVDMTEHAATVGLQILVGPAQWENVDDCTADMETTACKVGDRSGVQYRLSNGHCKTALTDSNKTSSASVRVPAFSAAYQCVLDAK